MERKVTWRTKGFKQYKNGSKGKIPRTGKKKNPRWKHKSFLSSAPVPTVFWAHAVSCNMGTTIISQG
jgi:hypothetical protein